MDFGYELRLRRPEDALELVTELNRTEGIQEVELQQE